MNVSRSNQSECSAHVDFSDWLYFINVLVSGVWEAKEGAGTITFGLRMGHEEPNVCFLEKQV